MGRHLVDFCEFGILKWKNQYSSKKYPSELQNLNGD